MCTWKYPDDVDRSDAYAAFNLQIWNTRQWLKEVDQQCLLARTTQRNSLLIERLQEIDSVERRIRQRRLASFRICADIWRRHCQIVFENVATWRNWLLRTTYWTVTCSVESCVITRTASAWIRSPNHCCNVPCTRNWVAAASSSLEGANTICSSPLPSVGRFTRSPGLVN